MHRWKSEYVVQIIIKFCIRIVLLLLFVKHHLAWMHIRNSAIDCWLLSPIPPQKKHTQPNIIKYSILEIERQFHTAQQSKLKNHLHNTHRLLQHTHLVKLYTEEHNTTTKLTPNKSIKMIYMSWTKAQIDWSDSVRTGQLLNKSARDSNKMWIKKQCY